MDFEDAALVRLADEASRAALFDQAALAAVAAAGYDHPEFEGPYSAVFDSVELVVDLAGSVRLHGMVRRLEDPVPYEVDLLAAGLVDAAVPRVTALWRGAVVARYRPAGEPVTAVTSQWLSGGPAGGPPGGPAGDVATGQVRVAFADPAGTATVVRRLPVTAPILARGAGSGVAALLRESAVVRQRVVDAGGEPKAEPHLRRRHAVVVVWLLPEAVFDDDDGWPGPTAGTPEQLRAARRAIAASWLARHGIALVTATLS
ncbi:MULTISPECIES: hypothetical protein [unclassified Frankia]